MMKLVNMLDLGSSAARLVGSSPTTRTTSEQALYRLLRLFYKSQSKLTPLLLLSKSNPLHWASIWFWVQTWKLLASILLRCSSSSQATYRLRRAFFISLQNSSYAHSAAPHSQVETDFPPFGRFFCFCDLFPPKKSRKNT